MESYGQSFWNGYVDNAQAFDDGEGLVLGIDFGSSNSCVAVWRADKNKVKIIKNSSSFASKTTPSLIQFNEAFKGYKIGNDCDSSLDHVISNLKALLLNPGLEIGSTADHHASPHSTWVDGTTLKCFDRPSEQPSTGQAAGKHATSTSDPRASKTVAVEDLVGFFLSYMKDCAEDYLTRRPIKPVNVIDGSQVETKMQYTRPITVPGGTTNKANTATATLPIVGKRAEVTRVVLGVPVNCTERFKRSLKNAAQLAGFTEVHFLAESTAAATAYGLTVAGSKQVLIFDMGGGTTDLSIMHIQDGTLTVQCTGGNNVLGGKDIDAVLLELVENKVKRLNSEQAEKFQSLSRAHQLKLCRQCKEELSSADQSTITIPSIPEGTTDSDSTHPKIDLVVVTREEFETAVKPITDLVEATVYHTLQSWQQQQQQQQENEVHGEQEKDAAAVEEEEVDGFVRVRESPNLVVNGTSAVSDSHRSVVNVDSKAPCGTTANDASVGAVAVIDEVVLVGGSSRVPCVRAALRRALGKAGISAFAPHGPKELCTSLNPEEVVAEGLAVRGAVLSGVSTGKLKELLMMDCVNNAIGVMTWEVTGDITAGGAGSVSTPGTRIFNSVLHKGMAIPAKSTLRFPLADANQRFVSLDIFEEVEEVKRKKDFTNSASSANPTNAGDASDFEITYAYNVVATSDIAIPSSVVAATDRDAVDITFTMTMDGVLQFTVVRVSGPSSGDNGTANINTSSVNMLIGYIVLMFALYLFVKIVLTEADVSSTIDSSFVNNVVAGAEHVCDSVSTVVDGQLNNATVDAVGGLHV